MVQQQIAKEQPENRYFSALQEMPHPLKRIFLKTFLPHWCKTLETYFSWIIFHGGGGVGASGGGCIGETAGLHPHRFLIYDLSVNSESQLFRFQIISPKVTVEEIGKLIVNFLFPKSLWFEFHRQSRTVPACNCRGTDRRKMKVKEMPFSQNLPLGE